MNIELLDPLECIKVGDVCCAVKYGDPTYSGFAVPESWVGKMYGVDVCQTDGHPESTEVTIIYRAHPNTGVIASATKEDLERAFGTVLRRDFLA